MKRIVLNFSLVFLSSTMVQAAFAFEGDVMDFDSIVSELQGESRISQGPVDPFDAILLHAGIGITSSYVTIDPENGAIHSGMLTGFEANFGIDLFSRHWLAEGALRTFNSEKLSRELEVDLREFDLKILYQNLISSAISFRLGGGVAARYLNVLTPISDLTSQNRYTTPASVIFAGLNARLGRPVTLGAEISYRNSLIDETIDRSSLTASLRLDAHF